MKKILLFLICFLINGCAEKPYLDERQILKQKSEAFQFLSTYHHQLHVMIGEEEGLPETAYKEVSDAIEGSDNDELKPFKSAIMRIDNLDPESDEVRRLDYLVDYYQSGLSLQIEGILRAYGYLKPFSQENILMIYDSIALK